jgi:hypothetical protein
MQWMHEHLWEPGMSMLRELFMHENKEIVDAAAISDARDSLSRMIDDFAVSRGDALGITPEQASKMAGQLDMHVLTRSYEKEIQVCVLLCSR